MTKVYSLALLEVWRAQVVKVMGF